jgi:guanylate kinase
MAASVESKGKQNLLEQLLKANPDLTPKGLGGLFPKYKQLHPLRKGYGMWMSTEKLQRLIENYWKHGRIVLLISGVSAGGKDAVREEIERLRPGLLSKVVTATTREIREGEEHGTDYYFYDKPGFIKAVDDGEFIENTSLDGRRIYGMPKKGLNEAFLSPEPVICSHVEMENGWPGVEEYFRKEHKGTKPFIIKVFVMPNMKFSEYAEWLSKKRKDSKTRLGTAAWELSVAADNADIILSNTIIENTKRPLTWEAQSLIRDMLRVLEPGHGFESFGVPFEISPGIAGDLVTPYHATMVKSSR